MIVEFGLDLHDKEITIDYMNKENITGETLIWAQTNQCFPNGRIISVSFFAYLRLFQNFMIFINFSIIVINYILIFVVIFKKRRNLLKKNIHLRNVLNESRVIEKNPSNDFVIIFYMSTINFFLNNFISITT